MYMLYFDFKLTILRVPYIPSEIRLPCEFHPWVHKAWKFSLFPSHKAL